VIPSTAPVREADKIIAEILVAQLGIPAGNIMLENQKWEIPETPGLSVRIGYVSGKVQGNTNYPLPTDAGMSEVQQLSMLYEIQIDLMSFVDSARVLKELAYMGLLAMASEQIQEKYNVQVARNPMPFVNASVLEETGRLNRYTTSIRLTQLITYTKPDVEYYSDFTDAVPPETTAQE
jgi:hypothetical protein